MRNVGHQCLLLARYLWGAVTRSAYIAGLLFAYVPELGDERPVPFSA